jgi:hypothetical protein
VKRRNLVRETATSWSPEVLDVANRLSELRTMAGVSG